MTISNTDYVSYSLDGDIAIATVIHPPVNTLSLAVRHGLMMAIARSFHDPAVKALIIIGGGTTFVAGADINDFGKPYEPPSLYAIIDAIMAGNKPVLAAIHGTALGGGLELALACQWRIASPQALIGQPEVKLGLMPGGGGTQWWTRLAGPEVALAVCTSGDPIDATYAHACGVIDRIADTELLTAALSFAREISSGRIPARQLTEASDKLAKLDPQLFSDYRTQNQKRWRGLIAPWKIVDCIEAACQLSFVDGYAMERQAFRECEHGPQSRAMIHLFFAERALRKRHKAALQAGQVQDQDTRCIEQSLKQVICQESALLISGGVAPLTIANALEEFGFTAELIETVSSLHVDTSAQAHPAPSIDDDRRIQQHLLRALFSEARRCMQQNLALVAGDVDVVSVNGLGFPAHLGGLMYWAKENIADS